MTLNSAKILEFMKILIFFFYEASEVFVKCDFNEQEEIMWTDCLPDQICVAYPT